MSTAVWAHCYLDCESLHFRAFLPHPCVVHSKGSHIYRHFLRSYLLSSPALKFSCKLNFYLVKPGELGVFIGDLRCKLSCGRDQEVIKYSIFHTTE